MLLILSSFFGLRSIISFQEALYGKASICLPKCGNTHYTTDQFQATGGNFSKIFDIQNKKFVVVSCTECGYSELYKKENSMGWDIFDFLTN